LGQNSLKVRVEHRDRFGMDQQFAAASHLYMLGIDQTLLPPPVDRIAVHMEALRHLGGR
jgi:hypothetical protein